MTDAGSSGASAGTSSVHHKLDAGRTPFHPHGCAQTVEDVLLAPIGAKGWKRVLPNATAAPQPDEPIVVEVNMGPGFYTIYARFANGATSMFKVPL